MNRRTILAALMGAAAAPKAVSAKVASELSGVSLNPPPHLGVVDGPAPLVPEWWRHPVRVAMEARKMAETTPEIAYPPHIRAMKSWSGTYKAVVYAREVQAYRRFEHLMDDPDNFTKLMKLLGVTE
jgi:hypothetical protein